MKVVVLTGGIASGKSTVSDVLTGMGVPVIDADRIAREVVEPGQEAHREIAERFGRGVLLADGRIDREALGRIVFSDPARRRELEAITHPRIGVRMAELIAAHAASGAPAVVLDIPLYIENLVRDREAAAAASQAGPRDASIARLEPDRTSKSARAPAARETSVLPADAVIVVNVDEATQVARLMARDGLSRADALARIAAQMPLSEKAKHADHVIDNAGPPEETARRVRDVWKQIIG
jgi:dephospho-CoA kinase